MHRTTSYNSHMVGIINGHRRMASASTLFFLLCVQMSLCPTLVESLEREMAQLHGAAKMLSPAHSAVQAANSPKQVGQYFSGVLEHSAVLLLQNWSPHAFAAKQQDLEALKQEMTDILKQSLQRDSERPDSESEEALKGMGTAIL